MNNEEITRQEALKKLGKYAAFTALGTIIMLTPKQAQAHSPNGNGHGHHGGHHGGGHGGGNGNGHGNRSRQWRKILYEKEEKINCKKLFLSK